MRGRCALYVLAFVHSQSAERVNLDRVCRSVFRFFFVSRCEPCRNRWFLIDARIFWAKLFEASVCFFCSCCEYGISDPANSLVKKCDLLGAQNSRKTPNLTHIMVLPTTPCGITCETRRLQKRYYRSRNAS